MNRKMRTVKSQKKKELNPFEIHVNKQKRKIIGQSSKNDRGLPGISRDKFHKIQKKTLLVEYKNLDKSNSFIDKRIGQKNHKMSLEDKNIARYSRELINHYNKKQYDDNEDMLDDEQITHKGQLLSEIEKFDDPNADDDDDDDADEFIHRKFVNEAHFGDAASCPKRSHKELIEDMIIESKKRKFEMKKAKDETDELTKELDEKWSTILPLISGEPKFNVNNDNKNTAGDNDYDKIMAELKFEICGQPSNRLKSEEEVAKEEREKLEQLEKERLERMYGPQKKALCHKSADDLDVDYDLDNEEVEEEEDDDDDDEDEEETQEEQEEIEEGQDESDKDEDNLSDLRNNSSDEDNVIKTEPKLKPKRVNNKSESVSKDIPYVLELPENYESFQNAIKNYQIDDQCIIIERIITCNHPKLEPANKEKLSVLLMYIIKYCLEQVKDFGCAMEFLDKNLGNIFDLLNVNTQNSFDFLIETLQDAHDNYMQNGEKNYPNLSVLTLLKLISFYCPTSDFRHQIVSPALIFISQMLAKCRVQNSYDVCFGLMLCTLMAEYTKQSKRFSPETISFLAKIIKLSISSSSRKLLVVENNTEIENLQMKSDDFFMEEIDDDLKNRILYLAVNLVNIFLNNLNELPSIVEIFTDIFSMLEQINLQKYSQNVRDFVIMVQDKYSELTSNRKLIPLHEKDKKPKALRLYEPRIIKITDRPSKQDNSEENKTKRLIRKFKKEKRGAIRKIRKDNAFLGRLKIKEKIDNDKLRQSKVKKIFADAAIQQHELKKLEKIKNKFK